MYHDLRSKGLSLFEAIEYIPKVYSLPKLSADKYCTPKMLLDQGIPEYILIDVLSRPFIQLFLLSDKFCIIHPQNLVPAVAEEMQKLSRAETKNFNKLLYLLSYKKVA